MFLNLSSQRETQSTFISREKAITIAKRHGLYTKLSFGNKPGITPNGLEVTLDSLNKIWTLSYFTMRFRNSGKTTKQYKGDMRWRCKNVNGCYVIKTRLIVLNAVSGKMLKKEKNKKIGGCYE